MLASVVREIAAPFLRTCPPQCGIVSITRVDVSTDESYATIYITALKEPERALKVLEGQRGEVQKNVGKGLSRARIPMVRFRIDHHAEEATHLDELLGKLSKELPRESSDSSQHEGH